MRGWLFSLGIVIGSLTAVTAFAQSAVFETKAKQVYLIDAETGTVLLAKNEDVPVPPASMAKLMTMEVVLDAVASGKISQQTEFPVSEHAWRTGGAPSGTSTMFAALKSNVRVSDLLQGVAVHLANDACIVLAEGLSGTEAAFAAAMTERGRAIGLTASRFANASGLPDPKNVTTMRDLVTLARHLQQTYPASYPLYSQADFEWNKIRQRNRNPLIAASIGVDGFAAGYAEGFGYGMIVSQQKDGRRVFLALSGLATDKERIEETRRILDWAMTAFEKKRLFAAGETVGEASVYGGAASSVPLVTRSAVDVLVPVNNPDRLSASIVYRWPMKVPVQKGMAAGTLSISSGTRLLREIPLETSASVEAGTLTSRATDALQALALFWL